MIRRSLLNRVVLALFCCTGTCTAIRGADPKEPWQILKADLIRLSEEERLFQATLLDASGSTITLSDRVVLEKLESSYVVGDKLVLLGDAGRTSAVEIYDLTRRAKSDWFYCYGPQRISDEWIAYVEFYPAVVAAEATDVLLVYDLTKSPLENRLERAPGLVIPPRLTDHPVRVGTPIYPEENARSKSYDVFRTPGTVRHGLLGEPLVLLSSKRLVFPSVDNSGRDGTTAYNHLVVVDLSLGFSDPPSRIVQIPRENLRRRGSGNPNVTEVVALEEVTPNSVRLKVPAGEYGVSSVVVSLPNK